MADVYEIGSFLWSERANFFWQFWIIQIFDLCPSLMSIPVVIVVGNDIVPLLFVGHHMACSCA